MKQAVLRLRADVEVRRISKQFEVGAEHEILLDVPVGEVRLVIEVGVGEVEVTLD